MPRSKPQKPPLRSTKMAVAGKPLRTHAARPRTSDGRLTYAGAERHEHKALKAQWEGAGE